MSKKELKDDFELSREVYRELLDQGREAIEEAMEVARQSQHPRAYEVLSKLINDVGNVNDKLLDVHKKQKDIKKSEPDPATLPGGNNLILTTEALQRMLISKEEKEVAPVSNG